MSRFYVTDIDGMSHDLRPIQTVRLLRYCLRQRATQRRREMMMKPELHAKGVRLTSRLRTFIEDRIRITTGRFRPRIQRLRIGLVDINGPRGGEDIQCHVHASLGRAGIVTIKEIRNDPYAAVARAIERAGQQLSRRLARTSAWRRGR